MKLLSIKQFADAHDVTRGAIDARVAKGEFDSVIVVIDGRKFIPEGTPIPCRVKPGPKGQKLSTSGLGAQEIGAASEGAEVFNFSTIGLSVTEDDKGNRISGHA